MTPRPGNFEWNEAAGRYINARGHFVKRAEVRAAIDAALDQTTKRARQLAIDLRERRISVDVFGREMRTVIKDAHLYSASAAKGGWAQMTPADYGRLGPTIREQYRYLDRLERQVLAGLPLDGRFIQRTMGYAQMGRTSFEHANDRSHRARGFDEERNILGRADHCSGAGSCIEQSRRGWVPIGTLVPVGERLCLWQCKCRLKYRRSGRAVSE